MKHDQANLLVIRKTGRTLKDSCFSELKWAANRLGVADKWDFKISPLEATYTPTGQKIYFRGLDDPLKITSIAVETGYLCWLWIEEAYEITSESDFDTVDESIRGYVPEGLFKQATLSFNPWNEKHWLKQRFFDERIGTDKEGRPIYKERESKISADGEILAITTNYKCNEWLDEADERMFERMRKNNPKRYQVAGLGNWGVTDGLVYENWREESFKVADIVEEYELDSAFGLDFGYTNDPTALFCGLVDLKNMRIWVFDEMYKKGLSNKKIAKGVEEMGYTKEAITADSAEPKSIDELKELGLRVKPAKKGKDSIINGIQWLQEFEIVIHPKCENFIAEIGNYTWAVDRLGKKLNVPVDESNHLMDAMRYATEKFRKKKGPVAKALPGNL